MPALADADAAVAGAAVAAAAGTAQASASNSPNVRLMALPLLPVARRVTTAGNHRATTREEVLSSERVALLHDFGE